MIELRNAMAPSSLRFRTIHDALRYKREAGLGLEAHLSSLVPARDPRRRMDDLHIAAEALRDAVRPFLWKAQIDRLVGGVSRWMPGNVFLGLHEEAAAFCEDVLGAVSCSGWTARSGLCHFPGTGPIPSRVETDTPFPHAWIGKERSIAIDITQIAFDRVPVTVLTQDDDRFSSLIETGPVSEDARLVARRWAGSLGDVAWKRISGVLGATLPQEGHPNAPTP